MGVRAKKFKSVEYVDDFMEDRAEITYIDLKILPDSSMILIYDDDNYPDDQLQIGFKNKSEGADLNGETDHSRAAEGAAGRCRESQ